MDIIFFPLISQLDMSWAGQGKVHQMRVQISMGYMTQCMNEYPAGINQSKSFGRLHVASGMIVNPGLLSGKIIKIPIMSLPLPFPWLCLAALFFQDKQIASHSIVSLVTLLCYLKSIINHCGTKDMA